MFIWNNQNRSRRTFIIWVYFIFLVQSLYYDVVKMSNFGINYNFLVYNVFFFFVYRLNVIVILILQFRIVDSPGSLFNTHKLYVGQSHSGSKSIFNCPKIQFFPPKGYLFRLIIIFHCNILRVNQRFAIN